MFWAGWSKTERERARFLHTTQNSGQVTTSDLFISVIFQLIFLDQLMIALTKTPESKTKDQSKPLHRGPLFTGPSSILG